MTEQCRLCCRLGGFDMYKIVSAIILILCIFIAILGSFDKKDQGIGYTTTQSTSTDLSLEETTKEEMQNNCRLLLNNIEIGSDCYVNINFEQHYAELPLIRILIKMGASVTWQDDSVAAISINGNEYLLNIDKRTLKKQGSEANYLQVAPGSNHGMICKMVSEEFICDSDTLLYFIVYELGAKMDIDYENAIISINF